MKAGEAQWQFGTMAREFSEASSRVVAEQTTSAIFLSPLLMSACGYCDKSIVYLSRANTRTIPHSIMYFYFFYRLCSLVQLSLDISYFIVNPVVILFIVFHVLNEYNYTIQLKSSKYNYFSI